MNGFTPAQVQAIKGWTEQRDALLRDIGLLSPELEAKQKATVEAGQNLAALHVQIGEAEGRLSVLIALEDRHRTSVAIDVSELDARKSRLEAECKAKEDESKAWDARQVGHISAIDALVLAHDKMSDQATIVDQVVGRVIETSKNAVSEMKTTMGEIRTVATEVIEKGNANIAQTNIVLEKLPRYVFELQRPIPIRRAYATPRGTIIQPEEKQ